MVERIVGNEQVLMTPEEAVLSDRQQAARATADTSKIDADYQNEPHNGQRCDGCEMFVPGFDDDPGGYCTKVFSIRGPTGMIFADGWCRFFEPIEQDDLRADYDANAAVDSGEVME